MAFALNSPVIGAQALTETSTTQKHPLGTIVKGLDPTYGEGEFIYLKGIGSTTAGSVVLIKDDYTTSLLAARDKGGRRRTAGNELTTKH